MTYALNLRRTMFDVWHEAALHRAGTLGLSYAQLSATHASICGAMGSEWLQRQERGRDGKPLPISQQHPLYRVLRSASDTALVTVCELALYLQAFRRDAELPEIIKDLRSEKYLSTFAELAMAYRWKFAGAHVTLAPPTPSGIADFAAIIDGTLYVSEVSLFPEDILRADTTVLATLIMEALKKAPGFPTSVTVKVRIDGIPAGDFHGTLRRAVIEAVRTHYESSDAVTTRTYEFGQIDVHLTDDRLFDPSNPLACGDWSLAARGSRKAAPAYGSKYDVHRLPDTREDHWIFLKLPSIDGDSYDALRKKFEKEQRQLSGVAHPRIIILDASGIRNDVLTLNQDKLNETIFKDLQRRPKVSACWIVNRVWTTAQRFRYHALTMDNPNALVKLPPSFTGAVAEAEYKIDFLTGKPFARANRDESR